MSQPARTLSRCSRCVRDTRSRRSTSRSDGEPAPASAMEALRRAALARRAEHD